MAASESVPEPHAGFTADITRTRLPASFTTVLIGESFSLFGTQISSVMIPLIVAITLSAGEITLGVVSAVGWLPIILIGLIAGAIVDRHSRWAMMVVCNITRAGLIGLIPILALTQNLTVTVLVVISFCMGVCNVFFDIAYQTYVPDIVPPNMLDRANNRFELIRSMAQLIGPLMGGFLAAHYRPEYLITLDAVTFLIAFIVLLLLPGRFRVPSAISQRSSLNTPSIISDMLAGLKLVWRTPVIRLVVLSGAFINIFEAGISALFVLYVTRTLGLDSSAYGIAIAVAGIGALCGALSYRIWSEKVHEGACVGIGVAWMAVGSILTAAAIFPGWSWICLLSGQFCIGYGSPIMNIALVTLRQKITPAEALGRVNASARVCIMSSLPIGALMISSLAEAVSISTALWVAGLGELVVLIILGPQLLRIRIQEI